MKNLIYILLLALTPVFTSCEDWFDVQPKSRVKASDLFDGEEGYKRALIGVYTLMADNGSYGANGTSTFVEVLGGAYTSVNDARNNFNKASKYDYDSNRGTVNGLWSKSYNAIANINSILESIDDDKDVFSEGIYEIVKGEAMALRAFIHFDLLRNFAPSPMVGLDEPAIPYVDMLTTNPFPQLTVNQVIERVIDDLKEAEALLKDYDPIGPNFENYSENTYGRTDIEDALLESSFLMYRKERMNYYATLGSLARVYMYRGSVEDKTEAYKYANDVINSQRFELRDSKEVAEAPNTMRAMSMLAQEYVFSIYKRNLYSSVNEAYFYFSSINWNELSVDEVRRNEFFEVSKYGGVADVRLNKLFGTNKDGLSKYLVKYNYNYSTDNVNRVPLLKVSEMYLIVAEAAESMDHLQSLRRKRGLKSIAPGTTLQEEIEAEYRKEFLGEGQMFYFYKRRNQLVNGNMTDVGKFVMPIPEDEKERGNIK